MDKKKREKARKLIEEIESLEKVDDFLNDSHYGKAVHFEVMQHYGRKDRDVETVIIERNHNKRFIKLVKQIKGELESELDELINYG